MTTAPIAAPISLDDLTKALALLGVRFSVDKDAPGAGALALNLSHGLVGASEINAIRAEQAAGATGSGPAEFGEAAVQAFNGAGCRGPLDDLGLLSWRANRTAQALIAFNSENGQGDQLTECAALLAAALGGVLSAAQTMRNPLRGNGENRDAARALHAAITAAGKAAEKAEEQRAVVTLLGMTD